MALKALPAQAVLNQLLRYEASTGKLYWEPRGQEQFTTARMHATWNARFANKEAFTAVSTGYRYGSVHGQLFLAHRIIWKMINGDDPDEIDHINGQRTDNRLGNLRNVTSQENHRNLGLPKHNTSGVIGVSYEKRRKTWEAHITLGNRKRSLGNYHSFDEAVAARRAAEVKFEFHENHGQR